MILAGICMVICPIGSGTHIPEVTGLVSVSLSVTMGSPGRPR
jgi:hypothetical protein